ncbi:MAG: D-glycero-beta-D-manno-heptose 1-phosphate adenylyltransferase [Melioribacteraceae bacterium]|nr:D-glycero-beta-D-manno-heptose 1-phosphate adenylyltransferase [Melioribacteraceae bacterium]MCF8354942.1 D-glycero-beta-D-manno-heptose 1-phosphate adenylyltransferase [Melioribacteraceae bacterium]MCF8392369.1 D-glycero-beta-D-manno-heptose 1-phosphate adenylyltransferase [Melioribacteraceae bacterium]MCF8417889.1 D-glycero-beta-D-manno-heptose 1-phosphate adenylyltransferase [Melioribacteraceae bacterium]
MRARIIKDRNELIALVKKLKLEGKKIVFTNGCFDIIHAGHVDYLNKAKSAGDILLVALNTDASVRRIKGKNRPIIKEEERAFVMSNLRCVDYVTFFDEDTPLEIISDIIPSVLVKGADWSAENIVGKDVVDSNGGEIKRIEFITEQSTSKIIKKIIETYKKTNE